MGYRMMGRVHATVVHLRERLREQTGQGTVEYVALILLVAAVMAAVVAWSGKTGEGQGIASKITKEISAAIDSVIEKKGK